MIANCLVHLKDLTDFDICQNKNIGHIYSLFLVQEPPQMSQTDLNILFHLVWFSIWEK